MCLAVPGKIVRIKNKIAIVDYGVEKREGALIDGNYQENDYVIVQGGIVVEKIPEDEAKAALELYIKAVNETEN